MTTRDLITRTGIAPAPLGAFRLHPDPNGNNSGGSGGDAGGTPTPPGDGAERVTLSRADYDALLLAKTELGTVKTERDTLKTDWSHAERLLKPSDNPEAHFDSMRHVMKKAGYTEAQVEAHIQSMQAGTKPANGRGTKPTGRAGAGTNVNHGGQQDELDGEGDQEPSEVDVLKSDLTTVQKQLGELEKKRLEGILSGTITHRLDTDRDLSTLIEAFAGAEPDLEPAKLAERKATVRETLRGEIHRGILDGLRQRNAQTRGGWEDGWIGEEAVKAAKAVYGKYRALVGDPSRLGRAPETDAAELRFANTKPVPPPENKKGRTVDQATSAVREWAIDKLSREAVSLSREGASVV